MTQLRVGDIVSYQGGLWVVILVNFCRAVIQPEAMRHVKIKPQVEGEEATEFLGQGRSVSISANADLPVVGRVEE